MNDVTQILSAIEPGDPRAAEQLCPLAYDALRQLAAAKLAHEAPGQTLQATALVHEAYLRLVETEAQRWNSQGHFFAAAAEAMRRILVDRARKKQSVKHGGGRVREPLDEAHVMAPEVGEDLTEFCDGSCLAIRARLQLFVDVCQAVQHAHQKGIIHRDIKPTNVMVTLHDGQPVVKVIDFGIAKAMGQQLTDKTLFTNFAQLIGTPLYMSPEQAEMSGLDVDTRSDIYSLGVLLYELLTGTTPFENERLSKVGYDEMRRIIRDEEPPKPSTRVSTVGKALSTASQKRESEPRKLSRLFRGELDWIVMKALEKDRNRRYETANAFALDVKRYLSDEQVVACPPSASYRFCKFARRNKSGLAAAALVLFLLVLLGSGVGWAVRDRSALQTEAARQQGARQAKVAGQVELIFGEVDRLETEQKWPDALTVARRAEAAVAGGEADPSTAERVRQRLKDSAATDRDYARAFRDYGVDVDALPVETSVDRLKTRTPLAIPLAAALDDWVFVRREISEADAARWKRLVAVARGIDPEPQRDRLEAELLRREAEALLKA